MPSHFVAVQLRGEEIQKEIRNTLNEIEKNSPDDVGKSVIDASLSHVTLFVVDISPERENEAVKVYNDTVSEFGAQHQQGLNLKMKNVKCREVYGGHTLLYADIIDESGLVGELTSVLKRALASVEGVDVAKYERKEAFLHTTLATSRIGDLGPRMLDKRAYRGMEEKDFGVQKVDAVQLLSIAKPRKASGYYHCDAEAPL